MPPTEPKRRARLIDSDEVDEYIRARRNERARLSASALRQDVLSADAEFTWEMPRETALRRRLLDDDVSYGEVLEVTVDDAWRAAAAARHAAPRAVEQSLDEWGERVADPQLRPVAASGPRSVSEGGRDREADRLWASAPVSGAAPSTGDDLGLASVTLAGAAPPAGLAGVPTPLAGSPQRRTVVITGRGAERYPVPRRHYSAGLRPYERAGFKPDRVALWAVVLCLALLIGAVASSH